MTYYFFSLESPLRMIHISTILSRPPAESFTVLKRICVPACTSTGVAEELGASAWMVTECVENRYAMPSTVIIPLAFSTAVIVPPREIVPDAATDEGLLPPAPTGTVTAKTGSDMPNTAIANKNVHSVGFTFAPRSSISHRHAESIIHQFPPGNTFPATRATGKRRILLLRQGIGGAYQYDDLTTGQLDEDRSARKHIPKFGSRPAYR